MSTKAGQTSLQWSRRAWQLPSVLHRGHASPTLLRLLRLSCLIFSAQSTDLRRFFLEQRYTVLRDSILLLMTIQFFFGENSRYVVHCWQVVGPSPQCPRHQYLRLSTARNLSTFAKRDTTLGTASFSFFLIDAKLPETICVSPLVCEWPEHASVSKFSFCLAKPLRSCLWKLKHTEWTAKSDQQVRRFRHSPLCIWNTLEESHSSSFRRTV